MALVIGAFSVYLSGRIVYKTTLNQIFNERVLMIEILGKTILENEIYTNASSTNLSKHFLQSSLEGVGNKEPGVNFFRLVDVQSRDIIASTDSEEINSAVIEKIPRGRRGEVSIRLDVKNEQRVVEISYLGRNDKLLWTEIDQSYFIDPAIIVATQQTFLLLVAFGLFGLLFFLVIRKFFMKPVRQIQDVLSGVEEVDEKAKDKKIKSNNDESFGELLESFSDVAHRIESTIEHDKVVSETKSDFISTTAHQLRTPLSGINWALGALLSGGDNLKEDQRMLLQRALEKTKELVSIVGELLSAAGIEQGKFGFHREELSLKEEIENTIEEEKTFAQKNKITLQFDHANEEFPKVYVDKERIRWVIRNLIENAIRYGKDEGHVTVSLVNDHKRLTVTVKDDGIGISPKAQQHIFQKFFRSSEAKKKRNDGSGIGLFIVRNIVNYHGGRMWFESVEGVGTTFFFTIPITGSVAPEEKK